MKPHISRHQSAQDEGQFSPYYIAPAKPHILPIVISYPVKQRRPGLALAALQVLACGLLGAGFIAAAILLRNILH